MSRDFIQEIGEGFFKAEADLQELNRRICEKLNKEFLRARLGGMYHTDEDNQDIFFRVSSESQNWKVIVRKFLAEYAHLIKTVTVVYDEESTGHGDLLKDKSGENIDHMLTGTFYEDGDCPL